MQSERLNASCEFHFRGKRKTEEITFDILESAGLNEDDIEKLSEKILYLLNPDNV